MPKTLICPPWVCPLSVSCTSVLWRMLLRHAEGSCCNITTKRPCECLPSSCANRHVEHPCIRHHFSSPAITMESAPRRMTRCSLSNKSHPKRRSRETSSSHWYFHCRFGIDVMTVIVVAPAQRTRHHEHGACSGYVTRDRVPWGAYSECHP